MGFSITLIAAAFFSACGQSDAPTAEEYDDIASSTAALISEEPAGEAEAARDAIVAARGMLPDLMTRVGDRVLSGRRGTLDYHFELTCSDASGAELASCEGADSARLVLRWDGSIMTARRTAELSRTGDWTLTGIQSPIAEFNGTGTFHADGTFAALRRAETRSYVYDYAAEYDAVTIDTATRRITGGSARYQISGEKLIDRVRRDVERRFEVSAEVEFLGDGRARITLDGERSYEVNLADGSVVGAD